MKRRSLLLATLGLFTLINAAFANAVNEDRYIVKVQKGITAHAAISAFAKADVAVDKYLPEIRAFVVHPRKAKLDLVVLRQLAQSGQFIYVEKDEKRWHALGFVDEAVTPGALAEQPSPPADSVGAPNDPMFKDEYHLQNINANRAWATTRGSADIIVAVVDTGVQMNHPDLKNQIWTNTKEVAGNGTDDDNNGYVDDMHGWDFVGNDNDPTDENGHGTHVAGIIGAEANNALGVAGVNWHVKIMPVRFLDARGSGGDSEGAQAIIYAVKNGARIINCSWGSTSASKTVQDAVEFAKSQGVLVVTAAGNSTADADKTLFFPSTWASISVASAEADFALSSFSNYGATKVDVVAPGGKVLSTYPTDDYKKLSGTSMASPVTAGVASLILSAEPKLSYLQLRNAVLNAVLPKPAAMSKVSTDGELDAAKAVEQLSGGYQLWPANIRIGKGESFEFTAYQPKGDVTWSVSDATIASIQNGTVQALAPGQVTVTAQDSTGAKVEAKLTVIEVAHSSPGVGCGGRANGTETTAEDDFSSLINLSLPLIAGFVLRFRLRKKAA